MSRPSTRGSRVASRCHSQPSQPVPPEGLPKEMPGRPDVLYRMITHQKTTTARLKRTTNGKLAGAKRPCTAPSSSKPNANAIKKKASIICSEEGEPLTPWRATPDAGLTRSNTRASNRSSQGYHASFADSTPKPASHDSKPRSASSTSAARFKSPSSMKDRKRKLQTVTRRRPSNNKQFTFTTFVKNCEEKEKSKKVEEFEFSEKENKMWQIGLTTAGMMPAVLMTNENRYYQRKFTKWARSVMDREKKFLSFDTFEGTTTPSFMPGLPQEGIVKLEQSHTPQPKRATPEDAASKSSSSQFSVS